MILIIVSITTSNTLDIIITWLLRWEHWQLVLQCISNPNYCTTIKIWTQAIDVVVFRTTGDVVIAYLLHAASSPSTSSLWPRKGISPLWVSPFVCVGVVFLNNDCSSFSVWKVVSGRGSSKSSWLPKLNWVEEEDQCEGRNDLTRGLTHQIMKTEDGLWNSGVHS